MAPHASSSENVAADVSLLSQKILAMGELSASHLLRSLIPKGEQKSVPAADDPVRMTQKATTAHMLQVTWTRESGWGIPEIKGYGKISLEPTASVLHYATETFEGMKVFRGYDGKLRLFRPQLNCSRLLSSNKRVSLPTFDPAGLLELIRAFVAVECRRWLPEPGTNLYLRPAMIGSGEALGINVPSEALFFLFGALFPQASTSPSPGIKLLASSPGMVRAWPGGFGDAKVGASYGPAMMAHGRAKKQGCSQTLWLLGQDQVVTEAGASNFFVIWKRSNSNVIELVTSSLDIGVVLPGVTRQSVLDMARERLTKGSELKPSSLPPLEIVERQFTMSEIIQAYAESRLMESFVTGTAMFITPVALIKYEEVDVKLPMTTTEDGSLIPQTPYMSQIKSWIEEIMYGHFEHEWGHIVEEEDC